MRERFLTGYNNFVLPFLFGMVFVLSWCAISMLRIYFQLPKEDRKKLLLSLINPKTAVKNLYDIFANCLLHVNLWKRNKLLGFMHSSIAFGWFMLIVIGHIECFLYTPGRVKTFYFPIFFRFFVAEDHATMQGAFFFFLMDFFLLLVLCGIFLAILKRVRSSFFGMRRTTNPSFLDLIGLYSLWAIFPLRLFAEGFTADISGGSFLTKSLNYVFHSFLGDHMNMLPTWWAYSCALCIFMVVLPFTRYMHIPAEILLIPLRNAGLKIRNPRKGFAKVQVFSCPNCGVCIDACPMGIMKTHIKDTTVYLNRQIRRKNEARIEEISDKCLLCGKCGEVCQVGVKGDQMRIAQRSLRTYNVIPDYTNVNPSAPYFDVNKNVNSINTNVIHIKEQRVIYFAGCMTLLTPAISKATENLLRKAGIMFIRMDADGGICCGRPMFMTGRYSEADQMIKKNKELIENSGADILLLSCPICYRIFKEKYHLKNIRVLHHSVYINELIQSGLLKVSKDDLKYVFHDPCELGRGTGIYEQPRSVLACAGNLVEARQNGKESICCGGSLGSISLGFDKREAMTINSLRNLTAENPDIIATACPLCRSTFNRYSEQPVKDIAEIIDSKTSAN